MRRFAVALALLACANGPAPPVAGRVLFVGNSLTYANDLPAVISALADSAKAGPIATESVVAADFSLLDHLDLGDAVTAIKRGGWDVVVLQQGPSSLDESRAELIASAKRFDIEIRTACTCRPVRRGAPRGAATPLRTRLGILVDIPPAIARTLQEAAAETLQLNP